MRPVPSEFIERGRSRGPVGKPLGTFWLTHPVTGRTLLIIAADSSEWAEIPLPPPAWEHVSVSAKTSVPRWEEMCWVKDLFFDPSEWVVQFHPAQADYVNVHQNVLHMWRVVGVEFPHPPKLCV